MGTAVRWLLLRVLGLGEVLGTSAVVVAVVGIAAGCDIFRDDAGLIAAIIMGVAVANMRSIDIPARRPFFETLVQLVIGLLFVSISATITPASLRHLVLPTIGLVAMLVLAVRPIVAALATLRTELSRGERALTGWMPRRRSPRRCRRTGPGCGEDPARYLPGHRSNGDRLRFVGRTGPPSRAHGSWRRS